MKKENKSNTSNAKVKFSTKLGVVIFLIGVIIIIISFVMNSIKNYNPYKEAKSNPKSIEDTFVVPDTANYSSAYHLYINETENEKTAYSKAMFSKHDIKNLDFKMEGGYISLFDDKAEFSVYLYNLNEVNELNATIDIKFIYYNNTVADTISYKIENLVPLEVRNVIINVDKKVINAYNYEISIN